MANCMKLIFRAKFSKLLDSKWRKKKNEQTDTEKAMKNNIETVRNHSMLAACVCLNCSKEFIAPKYFQIFRWLGITTANVDVDIDPIFHSNIFCSLFGRTIFLLLLYVFLFFCVISFLYSHHIDDDCNKWCQQHNRSIDFKFTSYTSQYRHINKYCCDNPNH